MFQIKNMLILRIAIVASVVFYLAASLVVVAAPAVTNVEQTVEVQEVELNETPVLFTEIVYKRFFDIEAIKASIVEVDNYIEQLAIFTKDASFSATAVESMTIELNRLNAIKIAYEHDIACYTTWEQEYPVATHTWLFLKSKGYSDIIASAIIGNMMIETAGGTLELKPSIYDETGDYYGLCQWSLDYNPGVRRASVSSQLDYLNSTIEDEFNTFGGCYKSGFTYEDFMSMADPSLAALAFAKVYERCGSGSYSLRQQAAVEAYNYFNTNN